jgi:hypothetical protein
MSARSSGDLLHRRFQTDGAWGSTPRIVNRA